MKPKRRRSKSQPNSDRSKSFKQLEKTSSRLKGKLCPTNLQEEKEKFLKYGVTPQLKVNTSTGTLNSLKRKQSQGQISFELFQEAKTIIEEVREKFGDEKSFWNAAYGPPIDCDKAKDILARYLDDNKVTGKLEVYWTPDLAASAKMMWRGPSTRYQKPEARRYSLIIKTVENVFLRERGIMCLADHEIGTHFFRMMNDGFQPWYAERTKFGLRGLKSRERNATEEGLACLNTVINAQSKYLFGAALAYYIACKAATMSFSVLFSHLERYVVDKDIRWKYVMRVKRGLSNPDSPGGYGRDQCYFEGAVNILRNINSIDFFVLYSGSVCVDEVNRVKRLARTECIRTPKFMKDVEKYKKTLRRIAHVNKLLPKSSAKSPTSAESPCGNRSQDCEDATTSDTAELVRTHVSLRSPTGESPRRLSGRRSDVRSHLGMYTAMWTSRDSIGSDGSCSNPDERPTRTCDDGSDGSCSNPDERPTRTCDDADYERDILQNFPRMPIESDSFTTSEEHRDFLIGRQKKCDDLSSDDPVKFKDRFVKQEMNKRLLGRPKHSGNTIRQ